MAAFLDPGFDFSSSELTEGEASRYLAWCARVHGEGNLDLVPFAEFFVEYDPQGLKRLRRHTGVLQLPISAAVLMWAHTYAVMGFAKGIIYEVIAARELGVTKAEVVDVLRIAGYYGGPFALNATGELTLPYLRAWDEASDTPTVWPAEWTLDSDALRTGIAHETDELMDGELDQVRAWYERVHGGMPRSLELAAATNPGAFKMSRVRFELLAGRHIPVELVALVSLHTAVACRWRSNLRRAVELALFLGIERDIIETTIHWGSVVGGEWALDEAFDAVADLVNRQRGTV